ncbi:MAG: SAM-dependent methyltransferase [Myxococcaceae bacterium]
MSKPYERRDRFFRQAKREGLRARSAYKLEEIADRFGLLRRGDRVLDLGAAPGGFLQVIARAVGETGAVLGVDRVAIQRLPFSQVKTLETDVMSQDLDAAIASWAGGVPLDLVVSDLAPKTTGIKDTDEARSLALADRALDLGWQWLRPSGAFAAKLFMGREFEAFRERVRKRFEEVKVVRPEATRGRSMEVYVAGLRRRAHEK